MEELEQKRAIVFAAVTNMRADLASGVGFAELPAIERHWSDMLAEIEELIGLN